MLEPDFIAALRSLPLHPGARSLRDDAAVLECGRETLVLTHDTMVEGVHYLPDQDLADVAWKLVAVNLSDLAGKGAEPVGVMLGHTLGEGDERFLRGLHAALATFGAPLLGGDTVAGGPPRSFGMTAIGRATCLPVPSRGGARPGDIVHVTGTHGLAMLGFEALRDATGADSTAFRRPVPRLADGRTLAPHVTAMMDVSDGLLLDAWRLAGASGVGIAIDPGAVPVADPARRDACLRWGDDYELLFTLPPDTPCPVPATAIGTIRPPGTPPLVVGGEAFVEAAGLGYSHAG